MRKYDIWTDGACSGNQFKGAQPMGGGIVARCDGKERELFGGEPSTTNNRMELTAVIEALAALKRPSKVVLHTDSQYVQKGISEWIHAWKQRGWRTADRQPVKNVELWRELDELASRHRIEWSWVKGHAGHAENERADALARRGIETLKGRHA